MGTGMVYNVMCVRRVNGLGERIGTIYKAMQCS